MASMKAITNVIAAIKTIYAYYGKDTNVEALVNTWGMLLQSYPDEEVDKALYLCLQTCKTPPTPADLIERIKDMREADEPSAEELWSRFTVALRRGERLLSMFNATFIEANGRKQGDNARAEFDKLWNALPEKLRIYMGSKGEFMRLVQTYTEDELKYERNRFMKTMPVIEKRQEYQQFSLTSGGSMTAGLLTGWDNH